MTIRISEPRLADALLRDLVAGECPAARTGKQTLEVRLPWLDSHRDQRHARMELAFFLRAWQRGYPGVHAEMTA